MWMAEISSYQKDGACSYCENTYREAIKSSYFFVCVFSVLADIRVLTIHYRNIGILMPAIMGYRLRHAFV